MANGNNDGHRVTLATVEEQVRSLDRSYQEVWREVRSLEARIETAVSGLTAKFETALAGLHTKLDLRSATPWSTIWAGLGLVLSILIAVGTLAYLPIQHETTRLSEAVALIAERGVLRVTYDGDRTRTLQDIDRLIRELEVIRVRTYDLNTVASRHEQATKDLEKRLDAISSRLAEFIRDSGKH